MAFPPTASRSKVLEKPAKKDCFYWPFCATVHRGNTLVCVIIVALSILESVGKQQINSSLANFNILNVFARIKSLALKPDALKTGLSASDAAMTLGIAPAMAKEHLLTAESKGFLCRDVSADGFQFYINFFHEIDPSDLYFVKDYGIYDTWVKAALASCWELSTDSRSRNCTANLVLIVGPQKKRFHSHLGPPIECDVTGTEEIVAVLLVYSRFYKTHPYSLEQVNYTVKSIFDE
ncbi:Vacuolar protein sorting-associated protein 36 [Vitis vinifera]|uniref:Vacuolar protein-sorting-associated protein 36 n=1 Tax=Vitis vinifera TaxID=29760 RepID=A0A438CKW5_VITVI|nr:Vacuolar protein sorting-associated protein 36 [Vitis vinifera]